jgi:hypothetical protein
MPEHFVPLGTRATLRLREDTVASRSLAALREAFDMTTKIGEWEDDGGSIVPDREEGHLIGTFDQIALAEEIRARISGRLIASGRT